ncbi:PDR/VanB family oxidoreductase [Mycolicibacterium sp. A43C]
MTIGPRLGPPPSSLHGHRRPDRLLRLGQALVHAYTAIVGLTPTRRIQPVNRNLETIVTSTWSGADDVMVIEMASATDHPLPTWSPGAHVDVTLPSGLTRQYSLCGDPTAQVYQIAVRAVPNGRASTEIHHSVRQGTRLTLKGPRDAFPFAYPDLAVANITAVTFIAAGIGITPILPMVKAADGAEIDWQLHYIGRAGRMPFLDELTTLDPQRVRIHHGRVHPTELLQDTTTSTAIYCCGPPGIIPQIKPYLPEHFAGFHFERFSPTPVVEGQEFTLSLAKSDTQIRVAGDKSALNALAQAGITAAYSCQQGFCGTCRVNVLSGEIDRRGHSPFLHVPESMLLCVDRGATDSIVIDL